MVKDKKALFFVGQVKNIINCSNVLYNFLMFYLQNTAITINQSCQQRFQRDCPAPNTNFLTTLTAKSKNIATRVLTRVQSSKKTQNPN